MKDKPLFSIVVIGRGEAKTLPRLLNSLREFLDRGGDVVYVDTGSVDGTPDVARAGGCRVYEEGDRFRTVIDAETAQAINDKFVVNPDPPIVKAGDSFFSFADARNYAKNLAVNDFICTPDCDEAWTVLDIDKINVYIKAGWEKLFVSFVFSHFSDGSPSVKFYADTRFYDRRKISWKGIIHETMVGDVKTATVGEDAAYLEHWQNTETDRSRYLSGLGWACYAEPGNDRNSHYFARELMYRSNYRSAIQEFKRHIDMNGWDLERGQSMVFLGNCYFYLGDENSAKEWWSKAIGAGGHRREGFLALADYYMRKNNPRLVAAYATASLEIPNNGFYANDVSNYTYTPYSYLYWAKGWLGEIKSARENMIRCLEYQPFNEKFLDDMQYYFSVDEQKEARKKGGKEVGTFHADRKINRIALPITRACNRNCPECSARMADPNWDRSNPHISVEELKRTGELLGPIGTIEVTGGEPSLHPDFEEISNRIHDWFQCKDIMLLTNGYLFEDKTKLPLLLNWDRVYVSWYTNNFARKYNTDANTSVVNIVEDYLKSKGRSVWVQRMDVHTPIGKPPYNGICPPHCKYDRGDSVGYGDGKIYGCCTAYWLPDKGNGIELTKDWREHLSEITLPCRGCFLTGMVTPCVGVN